ncbi:MAG: ribosome biogenesis factor YjgA [Rudaea sp.]
MSSTDVTSPHDAPAPSKTRRKQEMHALQELGVALVALEPARLATLGLPEALAEAIAFARRITRHEARRRQLQYIGRLMRDVDAAPIRAALAAWAEGPRRERARFAQVERWRERLLEEPGALEALVAAHPSAPRETLATLIADARAERERDAAPRHARMLFRQLARLFESLPPPPAPRAPPHS